MLTRHEMLKVLSNAAVASLFAGTISVASADQHDKNPAKPAKGDKEQTKAKEMACARPGHACGASMMKKTTPTPTPTPTPSNSPAATGTKKK
jgi:hypothetical protein